MTDRNKANAHGLLGVPFLLACGMLLCAHFLIGKQFFSQGIGGPKEMLELRKPLGELRKDDLGHYKFKTNLKISPEVEDALGAKDYLSWVFVDSDIEDLKDPKRFIRLFVTYYSGGRDLVPHTPDECFLGAGYQAIQKENLRLTLNSMRTDLPIRALTFQKSDVFGNDQPTVLYTFHCNGEFTETRDGVRVRINSPLNKYAYFCKIEISLGGSSRDIGSPSRQESIQAAQEFLEAVLPRLIDEHMPDWDAATAESNSTEDEAA